LRQLPIVGLVGRGSEVWWEKKGGALLGGGGKEAGSRRAVRLERGEDHGLRTNSVIRQKKSARQLQMGQLFCEPLTSEKEN